MKISRQHIRNPERVASRQQTFEKFRAAIAKAVPEYSPEELDARANARTDKAIAKGAIIVAEALS